MKKYFNFLIVFALFSNIAYAQKKTVSPSDSLKVISVKGKVSYKNTALKPSDVFAPENNDFKSFTFSSKSDFIRLQNVKTKKSQTLYALRHSSCIGRLGTRGMSEVKNNPDVLMHFSKPLVVFDADTIILSKASSYRTNNDDVYVWAFDIPSKREKSYFTYAGQNDTLFISHALMFLELDSNIKQFASFYIENVRLLKRNTTTKDTVYYKEMPPITIYFFDDIVRFLFSTGMTDEDVYEEISQNYFNYLDALAHNHQLSSEKEAIEWLKKRIELAKTK